MKTYLSETFNRFRRYSETLDAKTVLCNKCWWVFNDSKEKETYIFKEDGTVIISNLGAVTYGTWEYLPVNKSIIISGNNQSFMVLPSFVDEVVLVLQVDGTDNFAFLIDENNKGLFYPKTYSDVIKYFEAKEAQAIEKEKLIQEAKARTAAYEKRVAANKQSMQPHTNTSSQQSGNDYFGCLGLLFIIIVVLIAVLSSFYD